MLQPIERFDTTRRMALPPRKHTPRGKTRPDPIPEDTEEILGPAMQALTEKQRLFVRAIYATPDWNATEAAAQAGYGSGDRATLRAHGYNIKNNPRVIEAMREYGGQQLKVGGLIAIRQMVDLALNSMDEKIRLAASKAIADRSGFHAMFEQKITHAVDDRTMVERAKALAERLGIDPLKLLGENTTEAEFSEVKALPSPDEGPEDDLADLF